MVLITDDVFNSLFNARDGSGMVFSLEDFQRAGAGQNHHELRLKLLEGPREFFGSGVFANEIENGQVAFRIAHHGGKIAQFQQTNVTVMILSDSIWSLVQSSGESLNSASSPALAAVCLRSLA